MLVEAVGAPNVKVGVLENGLFGVGPGGAWEVCAGADCEEELNGLAIGADVCCPNVKGVVDAPDV